MDFYEISLRGMHKILSEFGEDTHAAIIEKCIREWQEEGTFRTLVREFSENGKFTTFAFDEDDFVSEEQNFWTQNLFGAMVAMAVKLAEFKQDGQDVDIEFIRENFGYPSDFLNGSQCTNCNFRQISAMDIDGYIVRPIIAARIVTGLEIGNMDKCVEEIVNVTAPEIAAERNKALIRAKNSRIPVSSSWEPMQMCIICGSRNIKTCRFLKNLKKLEFVALNG